MSELTVVLKEKAQVDALDALETALRGLCFEGRVSRSPGHLSVSSEGRNILHFHFRQGRLLGQGDLGDDYPADKKGRPESIRPVRYHSASVAVLREPRKIVADMTRRLVTPFMALWRQEHRNRLERRTDEQRASDFRLEVATALGRPEACDEGRRDQFRCFVPGGAADSSVCVDVRVSEGKYGCSLDVKYMTYDQARRVIAVLKGGE